MLYLLGKEVYFMVLLVNKKHMFNEIMLENLEMIEYENYKEDFILIERETFYHFERLV